MKTAAIIAEYNPFHNGHAYQLAEVRKRAEAEYLIVLMSGDYVQRGTPAVLDKYTRTEAALINGADLVLELPVRFAAGSAQRFADGAVSVLDGLGIVDELWFGSEEGELELFSCLAEILLREPEEYRDLLKAALKTGLSYPAARAEALSGYCGKNLESFLKAPNNILGLEYVLALKKRDSRIRPRTLKRSGSGYHEEQIQGTFSSATAIRRKLLSGSLAEISTVVPENCLSLYREYAAEGACMDADDLSEAMRYQLWKESPDTLQKIMDINRDLAQRILNLRPAFRDYSSFAELLRTRNQTSTAMQRALLHILLGITKDCCIGEQQLIRMLGMSETARSGGLLSGIPKNGAVAITANPGRHPLKDQYEKDRAVSEYYEALKTARTGKNFIPEYSRKLLVM